MKEELQGSRQKYCQTRDYIVAFNEQKVSNKKELMEDLEILDGGCDSGCYKKRRKIPVTDSCKGCQRRIQAGIWVRDNTQGIGTLTFVDEKGRYGALGHGISDVDTGSFFISAKGRYIRRRSWVSRKEERKSGRTFGLIRYEPGQIIGAVDTNSKNGIYGSFYDRRAGIPVKKQKWLINRNWKSDRRPFSAVWMEA